MLPVASTDDEPYAIVPCVSDIAKGSSPYSACTCTPSVSIQSMALGITVPCSAIDAPLKSTLPRTLIDVKPYVMAPRVIAKSALRHTAPCRVAKGFDDGCESDGIGAVCGKGGGGDGEGGGGDGEGGEGECEGCKGDGEGGGGEGEGGGGEGGCKAESGTDRGPQSVQSVPYTQSAYSAPRPPSSHNPSKA